MKTATHIYTHNNQIYHGYLADGSLETKSPAVLVVHDWSGCNAFAKERAELLAARGLVALAVDLYGNGRTGETVAEKQALMQPLISNRRALTKLLNTALASLSLLPQVDATKIAVIGFCFGGLCALDLARSGAEICGVVSFHGLLHRSEEFTKTPINAKILALHGYDDPMVSPIATEEFCQEMTACNADWQLHVYGGTKHAFTNPQAHDQDLGTVYNAVAAKRSWQTMNLFLDEVLRSHF